MPSRRTFLRTAAVASVGAAVGVRAYEGRERAPLWHPSAYRKTARSRVAVLAASSYEADLEAVVRDGFRLCGPDVRGKRVVVKPNLVEFDPGAAINTHPALIGAIVSVLRERGAREVTVAEGAGHRRDREYLLVRSGLRDTLRSLDTPFIDLNGDRTSPVVRRSVFADPKALPLHLPRTVLTADLLISAAKLKTHHWAGVTLSMKNLFGIMPGHVYGWPKNVLHRAGIEESILDINAALPVPRFNIIDGIVGMEGNGPIQGDAVNSGVLVFGADPVAVDATAARLMGVDPEAVTYIRKAGDFLGNIRVADTVILGEPIERLRREFRLVPSFSRLRAANA